MQNNNRVLQELLEDMKAGWHAFNAAVEQSYLDNDCIAPCVTAVTQRRWTEAVTRSQSVLDEARKNHGRDVAQALFREYLQFWNGNEEHMDHSSLCDIEHRRISRQLG